MAQGRYRFEDLTAICKETLQIITKLVPASVTSERRGSRRELHKFPRYVFEELHNLTRLLKEYPEPVFDELLSHMAALSRICKTLDPSLNGEKDGEITPIVIEPSHLDLIRSVVSNMEFSLLGVILSRGQSLPDNSTSANADSDTPSKTKTAT